VAFAAVSVVELECEKSSATTYFWYREALDISNSISESGGLNWKMTLCLLVAWSIVGMAVVKGIQSSGKVSWGRAAERQRGQELRILGP
jgi:solute carrier family 6 amino acid/orphan transporter-like 15/16/17/18/20